MAKGVEVVFGGEDLGDGFGVREGAETRRGDPLWRNVKPPINSILECHLGSSSLGLLEEEWFAILVGSVEEESQGGVFIEGELIGCEDPDQLDYIGEHLDGGAIHLCQSDVCEVDAGPGEKLVHVTRVRIWTLGGFKGNYLTGRGKKLVKEAKALERKQSMVPPKPKARAGDKPGLGKLGRDGKGEAPKKKKKKKGDVISLDSSHSQEEGEKNKGDGPAGMSRAGLRDLFKDAKERMTGGAVGRTGRAVSEDSSGGHKRDATKRVRGERRIVSGTNFQPGKMTPLAIEEPQVLRDGAMSSLTKRLKKCRDPGDMLLAQAAQQQSPREGGKRKKKDKKDSKKVVELLKKAVGGKKKKKKEKKKKKKGRKVKKDPDDPGGSGDSSSSSSSTSSSSEGRAKESDSDLSFEPPLRRKALQSPGSVLTDLIKHAQEQMDKGALMDHEGQPASLTSGVKLSTYFALLIRPYFPNNNPLLRELYQLAQAIDLLRLGRLAETGDAPGQPVRGGAYGDDGRQLASGSPIRTLSPRTSSVNHYKYDAAGSEAQEVTMEGPRILKSCLWPGSWWLAERRWRGREGREGLERQRQGKRKRKEPRCERKLECSRRKRRRRPLEREQGGRCKEGLVRGPSFTEPQRSKPVAGLEAGDGLDLFYTLACWSSSLKAVGCALAWTLIVRSSAAFERGWLHMVDKVILEKLEKNFAMLRGRTTRSRSPFPLPLGQASHLHGHYVSLWAAFAICVWKKVLLEMRG